jgi:Lamin Tail Domain
MMKFLYTFLLFLLSLTTFSQSKLVISQVYGGGGNSGATYTNDFMELFNPTQNAITITDWSIQYNSATSTTTTWIKTKLPTVTILPGQYYLIQQAAGAGGTTPLPTPDVVGSTNMSSSAGKVVLVSDTNNITASCPTGINIIDFVGFGPTANCFEGTAATAILSNTTAAIRNNNGCTDNNNNAADFTIAAPTPRNSASPVNICGGAVSPSLKLSATSLSFASTTVGQSSASQNYTLEGTNLTPAGGAITIVAPTDFQISTDNINWNTTATVQYTGSTLAAKTLYVRFTPSSAGAKTGIVTHTGGGVSVAPTVNVLGNATAPAIPILTATSLSDFGNICVGASNAINSFTINGLNLTNTDLSIAALSGFSYALVVGGPFTNTLTIPQIGGTFIQQVFVKFIPTANQAYNGNISITGGGVTSGINVSASGSGANNPPTEAVVSATNVTVTAATVNATITSTGCSNVTAYGIEYSTTNGFANGAGTKVIGTNLSGNNFSVGLTGLNIGTTYYCKAYATNAGGTTYSVQYAFTTQIPSIASTPLEPFGALCINTLSAAKSFTLSSAGLNNSNVVITATSGYSFSTTSNGIYTETLSITQPGGVFNQVVYVKFKPTAVQDYTSSLSIIGGGASTTTVSVSGSGTNGTPTVGNSSATLLSASIATIKGTITSAGCSAVQIIGIEYSGIKGFANGDGTKALLTGYTGLDFILNLTNLAPSTTYYYRVFVTNSGGTTYGTTMSFTTPALPEGLIIYATPIKPGTNLHYSIKNINPGHYQTRILNYNGQVVFKKDFILQVNFVDDNFKLPENMPKGMYSLQIVNPFYVIQKSFLVN